MLRTAQQPTITLRLRFASSWKTGTASTLTQTRVGGISRHIRPFASEKTEKHEGEFTNLVSHFFIPNEPVVQGIAAADESNPRPDAAESSPSSDDSSLSPSPYDILCASSINIRKYAKQANLPLTGITVRARHSQVYNKVHNFQQGDKMFDLPVDVTGTNNFKAKVEHVDMELALEGPLTRQQRESILAEAKNAPGITVRARRSQVYNKVHNFQQGDKMFDLPVDVTGTNNFKAKVERIDMELALEGPLTLQQRERILAEANNAPVHSSLSN